VGELVLVEECPAELAVSPDDVVVALSAVAAYALRRTGIAYEFVSEADEAPLREAALPLWEEQLAWLDRLDDALETALPALRESGLRPALVYGRYLKGVLDIVWIRAWELSRLLDRRPDRILLYTCDRVEEPIPDSLRFLSGSTVTARLLPLLAEERGIAYEIRQVSAYLDGEPPLVVRSGGPAHRLGRLGARLAGGALGHFRRFDGRGRLTLLLLGRDYDLGSLLLEARRHGHRCLLWEDSSATDASGLRGALRPRRLAVPQADPRRLDFAEAAATIARPEHELWRWPDNWFGVPLSQVVQPRIAHWVANVLPTLYAEFRRAGHLLERERVDFLVAPHMASISHHALVAAGHAAPRTESVQVEHGDGPVAIPAWDLFNLFPFDRHLAPSPDLAAYHRGRAARYERPTAQIHVGSYRWRASAHRAARRRRAGTRELLVYALGDIFGDLRYLHNESYPDVWLHELQVRLVEALGRDERYDVVVKPFPGQGPGARTGRNPIDRIVEGLGRSHMSVSYMPFPRWLEHANRVLLDAASTPVYETALARIPFVALLHERVPLRPEPAEQLQDQLVRFATLDEAVGRLEAFLADPAPPRPQLEWDGPGVLEVLEALGPVSGGRG
jgi:hypothetical protein